MAWGLLGLRRLLAGSSSPLLSRRSSSRATRRPLLPPALADHSHEPHYSCGEPARNHGGLEPEPATRSDFPADARFTSRHLFHLRNPDFVFASSGAFAGGPGGFFGSFPRAGFSSGTGADEPVQNADSAFHEPLVSDDSGAREGTSDALNGDESASAHFHSDALTASSHGDAPLDESGLHLDAEHGNHEQDESHLAHPHDEDEDLEGRSPPKSPDARAQSKTLSEARRIKEEKIIQEAREKAPGLELRELNKAMSDYISHNKFVEAWRLFEAWTEIPGKTPSVLSYNFAMHAMMRNKEESSNLMELLNRMIDSGLEPNQLTYNSLLRCAFIEKNSVLAEDIVRRMEKSTVAQPDPDAFNLLITLCAINRRLGASMIHLQNMLSKGFVPSRTTYNELLAGCSRNRRTRDATVILKAIHEQSVTPIPTTLGELLTTTTETEDPQCAILTLKFATQFRFNIDEGCLLNVLNLAARTGYSNLAELTWSLLETQKRNQPLFPPFHLARIHSYCSAGDLVSAFRSVRELEESLSNTNGIEMYKTDFLCPFTHLRPLTLACSRGIGVLDMAYYKLAEMHNGGEVVSLSALNCVIAGCSALRDYERSQQTFDEIQNTFGYFPDVRSYNALMDGYSKSGQAIVVAKLFLEMKEKDIVPDSTSYSIYVDSYIMSHDAHKAVAVLEEMVAAGHIPRRSLLTRVLKRARRSQYMEGAQTTAKILHQFGYRQESGSESKKRSLIVQGITQNNFLFDPNTNSSYLRPRPLASPNRATMWNVEQQRQLQKELLEDQW